MIRAFKLVPFRSIEDHFRMGWLISFPNEVMHHHRYGAEMCWICGCKIPGESQ